MNSIYMIVDLQFGSTGKGLFAGYLAKKRRPDTIATAWGPNAGHTFVDKSGEKMVNIALPNGIVAPSVRQVLLGPGSVIHPGILADELDRYGKYLEGIDLAIHEHAAVVQDRHRVEESSTGLGIGSTMKGVGAAVQEKIRRNVHDDITAGQVLRGTRLEDFIVTSTEYQKMLDEANIVQIEGAQGYSLSINYGFYPYTTSRDCTTLQVLSDCGIPANGIFNPLDGPMFDIYGVARTYPIRVANRYANEVQVGYSGPCYPDQREISWADIGREPELTTVTRLPRRIFTFSEQQIREAIRQNGVDWVFLNFANYTKSEELTRIIEIIERYKPVRYVGFGPTEGDIYERTPSPFTLIERKP